MAHEMRPAVTIQPCRGPVLKGFNLPIPCISPGPKNKTVRQLLNSMDHCFLMDLSGIF
jgi:hypothetical protein